MFSMPQLSTLVMAHVNVVVEQDLKDWHHWSLSKMSWCLCGRVVIWNRHSAREACVWITASQLVELKSATKTCPTWKKRYSAKIY